ncbi:hypothetical protein TFLX_04040 [Thermoflexales bacterium]|nr:hypothetical protein TFLX_04040 [Thermoflexales bacterium]
MNDQRQLPPAVADEQVTLNKRLEQIGWGLFLIMIGGIALVPDRQIPEGTWLIGAGLIMLGLNLARYINHLPLSSFTLVVGTLAIMMGASDFFGVELPFFPILLIVIGASILLKPLFERGPSTRP